MVGALRFDVVEFRDDIKRGSSQRCAQLFGVTIVDDCCFKTNLWDIELQKN